MSCSASHRLRLMEDVLYVIHGWIQEKTHASSCFGEEHPDNQHQKVKKNVVSQVHPVLHGMLGKREGLIIPTHNAITLLSPSAPLRYSRHPTGAMYGPVRGERGGERGAGTAALIDLDVSDAKASLS